MAETDANSAKNEEQCVRTEAELDAAIRQMVLDRHPEPERFIAEEQARQLEIHRVRQLTCNLSKEQKSFLDVLLERLIQNAHGLRLAVEVTSQDVERLEAKFNAAPEKLTALMRMEETGGEPHLTGIDGDDFIFDELARKMPESRRDVTYAQAVSAAAAFGGGARLMHPHRYCYLGTEMKIVMDVFNDEELNWVWLDTSDRHDMLDQHLALSGSQSYGDVELNHYNDNYNPSFGAFRCSLRV
jgi:hypothetical protein